MPEPLQPWTKVGDATFRRPMPPRSLEQAASGDHALMLVVQAPRDGGGMGWTVQWSSLDEAGAIHDTADDAMRAADRLAAVLARTSATSLAVQAGLDPRRWTHVATSATGRTCFASRREPDCEVRQMEDGFAILRHGFPSRRRFRDAREAADVFDGAAPGASTSAMREANPSPSVVAGDAEDADRPRSSREFDGTVTEVVPIEGDSGRRNDYLTPLDGPHTHVILVSVLYLSGGVERPVPVRARDGDLPEVGTPVIVRVGEAIEGHGWRPIEEVVLLPARPVHAPTP